jgi:serine/threonine-protein phosphatase 6 regulatory ankyrin repeat subunit B
VNVVKILFKYADETWTTNDEHRHTPLTYAVSNGQWEVARVLLEGGANIESTNANGSTAVHCAAYFGHLDICRLLLDWGAKVDPLNNKTFTPLHEAAEQDHLAVAKLLVKRGADVWVKTNNGQTASDLARSQRNVNLADWLDSISRG